MISPQNQPQGVACLLYLGVINDPRGKGGATGSALLTVRERFGVQIDLRQVPKDSAFSPFQRSAERFALLLGPESIEEVPALRSDATRMYDNMIKLPFQAPEVHVEFTNGHLLLALPRLRHVTAAL